MEHPAPMCSVIVSTYNRAQAIQIALRSLVEQTAPPDAYEIIVVDDGSEDNTAEVIRKFIDAHPSRQISYYRLAHGQKCRAWNAGIKNARGKYIFFTDDDCVVPPNWIGHHLKIYKNNPDAAGVGGAYIATPKLLAKSIINQYIDQIAFKYRASDSIAHISSCFFLNKGVGNTANVSYRKEILEEIGGFDEKHGFQGGDFELKKRILNRGWKLYYTPLHAFHLKEHQTYKDLFRFGMTRAKGMRAYAEKFSDLRRIRYGAPSLSRAVRYIRELKEYGPPRFWFFYAIEQIGFSIGWLSAKP